MAVDPRANKPLDPDEVAELQNQEFWDGYDAPEIDTSEELEKPAGVSLVFTPKQIAWWEAVTSGLYNFMAIGGAIRGTKTFTVLITVFMLMKMFPRSRHVVVRKDLPVIRRNILPPIEKLRAWTGDFLGPLNMTSWEYTAKNGSKLLLMPESKKDDPDLEDFRGLEVNTFTLEEANEMTVGMKSKAIERAGSYTIPPDREQSIAIARAHERGMPIAEAHKKYGPAQCPPYVFFTFNPADNWVREDIYDPYERGELEAPWLFVPATIYDNPFADERYIASLQELKKTDPDAYDRFVLGIWGNIRVENQLIDPLWLPKARDVPPQPGERRLGADIARYGKDSTVFVEVDGNTVTAIQQERHIDTSESATIVTNMQRARSIPAKNIVIDVNGLGAGTVDAVRANNILVNEFNGGERPVRRTIGRRPMGSIMVGQRSFYHFKDRWSQAAWEAREKIRNGKIRLVAKHPSLTRHLTSFRYVITNREISVWSSDKVREELGFSPDVGVAVILALFEFPERNRQRRGTPTVVIGGGSRRLAQLPRYQSIRRGMRPR